MSPFQPLFPFDTRYALFQFLLLNLHYIVVTAANNLRHRKFQRSAFLISYFCNNSVFPRVFSLKHRGNR